MKTKQGIIPFLLENADKLPKVDAVNSQSPSEFDKMIDDLFDLAKPPTMFIYKGKLYDLDNLEMDKDYDDLVAELSKLVETE